MSIPDFIKSPNPFLFTFSRRFFPLFSTQFCNAINDNLFKTALFILISFTHFNTFSLPSSQLLNLASFLFIVPFFLFSSLAGDLANKMDKAYLARWIKVFEIVIMLLASIGFIYKNMTILLICLFLMGTHSTLFGPLKYAILSDYLKPNELVSGNGLIEAGTFLAILLGQILGSVLTGFNLYWLIATLLLIAVIGQISSLFMLSVQPVNPDQKINFNIIKSTRRLIKQTYQQKNIWAAIMGISWFWMLGSIYITQLPTYTKSYLGGNESVFNLLLTLFSIGIGLGSLLCAKLSHEKLHLSLIIPGICGLIFFGLALVWLVVTNQQFSPSQSLTTFLYRDHAIFIIICILGLGFSGGFFSIPLYTWLQIISSEQFRTHAIAANNIINGFFMVLAAIISALIIWLFDNINLLFFIVAIGNIITISYLLIAISDLREDCKSFLFRKL